jgi:hypothetical protein
VEVVEVTKPDPTTALYAAIESEAERVRVWRLRPLLIGARPAAEKRKEYRERATKAAMEAAVHARFQRRMPTHFELENAAKLAFSKDEKDEVGSFFLTILAGVIARLIVAWLLKGKALEPAGQETTRVN